MQVSVKESRMTVLRIKNWADYFENSSSRKLLRMTWVAIPLKHGTGYRRLLALENGPALYGAWISIVRFATTCPVRGTLVRSDGKSYSASDIAIVEGFPVELIKKCLEVVTDPEFEIEWIEKIEREILPESRNELADSPGDETKNGKGRETLGDDGRKPSAQNRTKTGNGKTEQDPEQQNKTPTTTTKNKTAPPSAARPAPDEPETPADDSQATWGLVATRLRGFGLARVNDAITEAKEAGFTSAQVDEWIDWLTDPKFPLRKSMLGPGVIIDRIRTSDALFWKSDFGWPPVTTDATPTGTVVSYPYAKPQGTELTEKEKANLDRLEAEFGPAFDRMNDLEVFALMGPQRATVTETNIGFRRTDKRSRLNLLWIMENKARGKLDLPENKA